MLALCFLHTIFIKYQGMLKCLAKLCLWPFNRGHLEPSSTSKIKLFRRLINDFQPLTIFAKINIWLGSEYASAQGQLLRGTHRIWLWKLKGKSSLSLMKFYTVLFISYIYIKVGFSLSKKIYFICFNESLLKMMKNAFYVILKALSVLKVFKTLSWLL